jgi:hypothetical protein
VNGERREFDIAVFFTVDDGLIRTAKVYREGSADIGTDIETAVGA